ncbi:hypothetical protein AALP_AAs73230U000300 [Arabis alpina]|uniref:C-JID domain-containing protein n=1 Tax=Arabis alpina TaxID=50452 RepID=A0A087FWU4_ARAAL|nr:hypothetical protein AALP_AAs73230U000300 [Arabis alpina]
MVNATNLKQLNLSGCSSLVELSSSIGNATNLNELNLNVAFKRLLKAGGPSDQHQHEIFPDILTNIRLLKLTGTAIEEIPSSVSTLSRFHELHILYITKLHLSDKRIQEIPPSVKELSRLKELEIKGCTKLVSLPQLPESLRFLNAENCESLERLDCSFQKGKFTGLYFTNCFKLNQEARDLIIIKLTSSCENVILPGEKVPPQFTYKATGSSLSIKLSGIEKPFPASMKFQACLMLVKKGDFEVVNADRNLLGLDYSITEKQNGVNVMCSSENMDLSTRLKKHLLIFQCEEKKLPRLSNLSSELVFEFQVNVKKFEIEECGIRILPKSL